jgi:hypothetical protein
MYPDCEHGSKRRAFAGGEELPGLDDQTDQRMPEPRLRKEAQIGRNHKLPREQS